VRFEPATSRMGGQRDNHYATETYSTTPLQGLKCRNKITIFALKDNVHNKFKKYNARFSNISSGQAICMTLIYYNIEEMPISVVVIHQVVPLCLTLTV